MEESKSLSLRWRPSNYFIIAGVFLCLGLILLVMQKYLTSYLLFITGVSLFIWPVSRLLKKGVKAWTFISVIVYLAFAYYLGSLQADTFPTWKTVLFAVWALLLLLGYLFSFRRGKVQKI